MKPIDPLWLKNYIDILLKAAKDLGTESAMGKAALLRAEAVIDMVASWKERENK
jgi:hypothetical protein